MVQEGDLLEATGQPAIYVIQGGLRHWIPDMATFYDNDFDPTKVKVISENELNAIPLGDPLPQSHRFVIDHETEMGANHFMATHGAMSSKTGQIHAQTET